MRPPRPNPARIAGILAAVAILLLALAPSAVGHRPVAPGSTIVLTHRPVTITLANPASDGHQLGDLRVTSVPVSDESGESVGRLDATLTTVGIDAPEPGDEVRLSTLVFVLGDGSDQIVVNGSALYPKSAPTIAASTAVVRPVTGGSGRFAGASGWAESEHLADGTWRHTLHLADAAWPRRGARPLGSMDRRGGWMHLGDRSMRGWHPSMHEKPAPEWPKAPDTTGVVRTLLGEAAPTTADGQSLALWHYTIPAGTALVPHTHPGFQVARIVSGSLTYNVIEGQATILRADGSTETVTSGQVVTLDAGDSVVENPDLVHFGANDGPEPVVIYAASLFATGEAPAHPLPSPAS